MAADLNNPIFNSEEQVRAWLENQLWLNGPVCPHCGAPSDKISRLHGRAHRPGLYQCNQCREQFTVTVGTIFERSKIPLDKWLRAVYLLCASKKGISSHQLHRMLGISYKSTWFMTHRIREAMRSDALRAEPMGGPGAIVEIDETFIGRKKGMAKQRGYAHKHAVLTLIERGGPTRSFHVEGTSAKNILPILVANIRRESRIMTDEAGQYSKLKEHFGAHEFVVHSADEYVRGEVHVNTAENFYSIFKRGMKGVYQHCGEQHLHRYVGEFDFRYNNRAAHGVNDLQRTQLAVRGAPGKRLIYRQAKVTKNS